MGCVSRVRMTFGMKGGKGGDPGRCLSEIGIHRGGENRNLGQDGGAGSGGEREI